MAAIRWITSLNQVKVGRILENIGSRYEADTELRFNLMAHGYANTAYPLYLEKVAELCNYPNLWQLPTAVMLKKTIIGYLAILDHYISLVEGRGNPVIITAENQQELDIASLLRSYWLSEPEYATAVRAVYTSIKAAAEMFSLQEILHLIHEVVQRGWASKMDCFEGLTNEDLRREYDLVDNWIYRHGKILFTQCEKPYLHLATMPQIYHQIGGIFFANPDQMAWLLASQMNERPLDKNEYIRLQTPIYRHPDWRQQASGLFVLG